MNATDKSVLGKIIGELQEATSENREEREALRSSEAAYKYARNVIEGPWPKGEDAIATSAQYSHFYAANVLKGPFPKGEAAIAKNAEYSYLYAMYVIKGPWSKGEDAIAKDAQYSYLYAANVLGLRGEEARNWKPGTK